MFLNALVKRNPKLIEASVALLSQGKILPDSYVIDVDAFIDNAKQIKRQADKHNIKLYGMTKQFGRNPLLAKILVEQLGYAGIVCVDFKEARFFQRHGIPVAHVGHLVQLPESMLLSTIKRARPEVMTVTCIEKAKSVSQAASQLGITQDLLLKFYQDQDELYINQESGFALHELDHVCAQIEQLPNVRIAGITHFPCMLLKDGLPKATHNVTTMQAAHHALLGLGHTVEQVNMPSFTCCATLPELARNKATHAEPGHALTGTTPNNCDGSQTENLAMLYISEISHHFKGHSYCFGGGYYRRGNLTNALVLPRTPGTNFSPKYSTITNDDESSIDYHLKLDGEYPIGAAVVMAFRSQVFVTRSDVALVKEVQSDAPHLMALFDALGNEVSNE